jgi:large subunit ribosomal protein L4
MAMQVPVKNMAGETVGQVELSDRIFAAAINEPLMHQALLRQLANSRLGTHKAKTRSEVSGGGRKPWKQKGTGHARQGSNRAPQWRHGAVVFGPRPRSYEQRMPRKMRQAALRSALSAKLADDRIVVVDQFAIATPKTRDMVQALAALAPERRSALILMAQPDATVQRATGNLAAVKLLQAHYLNVRDLLSYDYVLIPQAALTVIERFWDLPAEEKEAA